MSDVRRRFLFGLRLRTIALLVIAACVGWTAYSTWADYSERAARREREPLSPSPGDLCTVVLRADALGMGPMAPHAARINGVDNSIGGRFVMMNDQWLKLEGPNAGDPQQWIPRENVLLIQVNSP